MSQPRTLSHDQARRVYDRIGPLQDSQRWYEDRAVAALAEHADFAHARAVLELGCGTGRHAATLLAKHLPAAATYVGQDVSPRMVGLTRDKLRPWADRARVVQTSGAPVLDVPDRSIDRFFSTYVLDLLSDADIRAVLAEAHRALADDGRLCVVGAAPGRTLPERAVMGTISWLHARHPALILGCRPIDLLPRIDPAAWRIDHARTLSVLGVCSQIVVATPRRAPERS